MNTRPGKRTGPKPKFLLADATQAALDIGLADFTLAQVAKRLGVGTSSLYRVVQSRDELVTAAILQIVNGLELVPAQSESWEDILQHLVCELWQKLEEVSGLSYAIINNPMFMLQLENVSSQLESALIAKGFPGGREKVWFALDFIFDTVITTHYQLLALKQHLEQQGKKQGGSDGLPFIESLPAQGFLQQKIDFIIAGIKLR